MTWPDCCTVALCSEDCVWNINLPDPEDAAVGSGPSAFFAPRCARRSGRPQHRGNAHLSAPDLAAGKSSALCGRQKLRPAPLFNALRVDDLLNETCRCVPSALQAARTEFHSPSLDALALCSSKGPQTRAWAWGFQECLLLLYCAWSTMVFYFRQVSRSACVSHVGSCC